MRLLYPKIAADGIRKNKRLYLPFYFSSILMVAVVYIVHFLGASDVLGGIQGEHAVCAIMAIGSCVVALFSAIVLFYTHATLFKGRVKEFGLYSMLGMNKRNIAKIIFYENLFNWFITITGGLITGIAFSKLAELGFAKITNNPINYLFVVNKVSIIFDIIIFSFIFGMIYINSVRKIGFSRPVELVREGRTSEKPPRANWLLGLFGLSILCTGYAISFVIQDPFAAIQCFFGIAALVVIGTFITLISFSVLLCRILQRNKNYYYKTNHFVSVSSMAYRMKRNGAGLAAICVLLTMTLVTLATTVTLYSNISYCVDLRYPYDINSFATKLGYDPDINEFGNTLTSLVVEEAKSQGAQVKDIATFTGYSVYGNYIKGEFVPASSIGDYYSADYQYVFVDVDDFNTIFNSNEQLGASEVIVASNKDIENSINIANLTLNIVKHVDDKLEKLDPYTFLTGDQTLVYVFVNDLNRVANDSFAKYADDYDDSIKCIWRTNFNTGLDKDGRIKLANDIDTLLDESRTTHDLLLTFTENSDILKDNLYINLGGLLFLGSLLSIIFLISSFVIMYYKQISEGIEDQSHFTIMQKVGMTKKEIRKSIESQMFTLFFIPITLACINLIVALPLISKILYCLGVYDPMILVVTAGICVLCCGLIYVLAYKKTSNSYYKIVSN